MESEAVLQLEEIEAESRKLDISPEWSEIEKAVLQYCRRHLEQMDNLPAYVDEIGDDKKLNNFRITNGPKPIKSVLSVLDSEITTPGLNPASGGHLGYIPGGGLPTSALGDYIAAVTNKYAGVFYGSPGAVRCENFLIDWMCRVVGFPETAFGNLASGGSISNLIGILCARDKYGMTGARAETGAIYLTPHAHHCIRKALHIAGLACAHIRYINQDADHKMDVADLKNRIKTDKENGLIPFMVIGNAGTTDTGVVDPLDSIADVAETHDLWYHVDGAYGGFFVLLDELKHTFKGMERADSIVLDPHKGLFLPYGSGAILVRDRKYLTDTFTYEANYMQDAYNFDEQLSPANVSPELTKHFRGLRMWLPLQIHGLDSFKACLHEKILLTRYFHSRIGEAGFETGSFPALSITTYRFVPPKGDADLFNRLLMDTIKSDGTVFVSSTNLNGNYVLRLAVLSFRTHLSTINVLLDKLISARDHLLKNHEEFC